MTTGHQGRSAERRAQALAEHGIDVMVHARLAPLSPEPVLSRVKLSAAPERVDACRPDVRAPRDPWQ